MQGREGPRNPSPVIELPGERAPHPRHRGSQDAGGGALSIHAATTREGWHVSASSRRYSRAHRRRNDPNADSATVVVFHSFNARSASATYIHDISAGSLVRSHDPRLQCPHQSTELKQGTTPAE
ncbi:hypothetical protein EJB05_04552, partial [Eragrostis curvula]